MSYPPPTPNSYGWNTPLRTNGFAIASLVLGTLSILMSWIPVWDLVLWIMAVILGFVGLSKANKGIYDGKTMSLWGIALGLSGLLATVLFWTFVIIVASHSDPAITSTPTPFIS